MSELPHATAAVPAFARPITISVNDETRGVGFGATLSMLASELGFAERKGIAIAVNGGVVPRASWPTQTLRDGDRVLVIRATQGG